MTAEDLTDPILVAAAYAEFALPALPAAAPQTHPHSPGEAPLARQKSFIKKFYKSCASCRVLAIQVSISYSTFPFISSRNTAINTVSSASCNGAPSLQAHSQKYLFAREETACSQPWRTPKTSHVAQPLYLHVHLELKQKNVLTE